MADTPTIAEQIAAVKTRLRLMENDLRISAGEERLGRDYEVWRSILATLQQHEALEAALKYAVSFLENEYKSDPNLQGLAQSLRAALDAAETPEGKSDSTSEDGRKG